MENKLAIEVAKNLLKIKAVFLKPNEPFTWASGIKSPIYCDNRLTLSYPETRKVVEEGLAQVIKTYFQKSSFESSIPMFLAINTGSLPSFNCFS